MAGERIEGRSVLRIAGADREKFLHGLVTRDVGAPGSGLAYSALLTPQGKYLADFFLLNRGEDILLDVASTLAPGLVQRLTMYRLRAAVTIEDSGLPVVRGLGDVPEGAFPDPRHPALGWRGYGLAGAAAAEAAAAAGIDWDALRVAACVPETGIELRPGDSFILEMGFDRLGGVDHRKGCYVGQEVTARMKHKTELRKGLVTVTVTGPAEPGTPIRDAEGREAGTLFTRSGGQALAFLRFDRAEGPLWADTAEIALTGG